MIIRRHVAAPNGRCLWCGAAPVAGLGSGYGDKTCISRDDGIDGATLHPEPRRRQFAHEDAEAISGRLAELRGEREAALNRSSIPDPT